MDGDAERLTCVLSTAYPSALALAESILEAAGIEFAVRESPYDEETLEVCVDESHAAAARALLAEVS